MRADAAPRRSSEVNTQAALWPLRARRAVRVGLRRAPRGSWKAVLFLVPASLVLAAVFLIPLAQVLGYSLTDWRGGVRAAQFVGLDNYLAAARAERVRSAALHNLFLLIAIPVEIGIGVFVASVLRERVLGWRIYRFLVLVPLMISITIVGYTWTFLLSPSGVVNTILNALGGEGLARTWLADPLFALPAVAAVLVWRDSGFAVILFYSRLLAVDEGLYEAARIDGAGRWQRMVRIDLPLLRGAIAVFSVLMTIWLFSFVFNYVFVMTGGGPGYASTVLEYEIYRQGFKLSQMGYASAIAVLLLLITLPIVVIQVGMQIRRRSIT